MNKSLKLRQVCLFFIAFVPVTKFFMMPSIMAKWANEDLWISALINVILDGLTILCILLLCQKNDTTFYQMLESLFGKTGKKVILVIYALFFLTKSVLPISEQKDYVELTLYITTPNIVMFLPFFGIAFFLSVKKLRVLGRVSDLTWAITGIGVMLIIFLSLGGIEPQAILPVGANGIKNIALGSYSSLNWYGDCLYFVFFTGEYIKEKNGTVKILISYFLAGISTVLFTIIFYSAFTSIAFRQRFALTEISKYTTVINDIGRFDYLAIFFILYSTAFALSLPIFFANKCLENAFPLKRQWIFPLITCSVVLITVVFFEQYFMTIEYFMTQSAGGIFLFFSNVFPIIIAILYSVKNKEGKLNEKAFQ